MKTRIILIALLLVSFCGCATRTKSLTPVTAQQLELEQAVRRHQATQSFIYTADSIMRRASQGANQSWTQAGKNKAMIDGLETCLELQPPKDADYRIVNEYKEVCRAARRWFVVNPTWKTNAAYGIGGAVAATIDFFGGFGTATATLVGFGVRDMHDRNEIRKNFLASIDKWNKLLVNYEYESTYWRI